jgi:hypothetical protein
MQDTGYRMQDKSKKIKDKRKMQDTRFKIKVKR